MKRAYEILQVARFGWLAAGYLLANVVQGQAVQLAFDRAVALLCVLDKETLAIACMLGGMSLLIGMLAFAHIYIRLKIIDGAHPRFWDEHEYKTAFNKAASKN